MLDGTPLYPNGFHPARKNFRIDKLRPAKYVSRSSVPEVRYYITDFGLSSRFEPGKAGFVTVLYCQDRDVPELSDIIPYDPFAVDIFTLGNVFKKEFLQVIVLYFVCYNFLSHTLLSEVLKPSISIAPCG